MTDEEFQNLKKGWLQSLKDDAEKELQKSEKLISSFKEFCASRGVLLTADNFKYVQRIGIVACYPNIVEKICPTFSRDKEGLVNFNLLRNHFRKRPFINGYFSDGSLMLMAHPYYRRSFYAENNFAPHFIDSFWRLDHSVYDSFIALDYDCVRINVDETRIIELDTWYGAKFNEQISQIPDGIVKLRPPAEIEEFNLLDTFAEAYSLDIKWETKDDIKTFQAEEFKSDEIKITKDGQEFFPVRYIHAEFDLRDNKFRHFDGAIHFYTSEEYFERRDSDFNYNLKNSFKIKSRSEKLFKINGQIEVEIWRELSSHFLTGNPLIIEYFEGKYPDYVLNILEIIRQRKEGQPV